MKQLSITNMCFWSELCVGHGDDLLYLFDALSLGGESTPLTSLTDPVDRQVRDQFTDLVATFARTGEPMLAGRRVKPFTAEGGDYMVVNSTPTVAQGFRRCQMGLWAGLTNVLKSPECNFLQLGALVGSLEGLTKGVTTTLTNTTAGLTNATAGLTSGLGGLLGGGGGGGRAPQRPLLGLG
uniref:Uncharacterized protein n=1 Tax=Graphocephala atropunctata TaxID=36148 RepID=A0A1B6LHC5_9HEMI